MTLAVLDPADAGTLAIPKHSKTNVTEGAAMRDEARRGLLTVFHRLAQHCGPHAAHAVVPTRDGVGKYHSIFTKDGIDIVRQMTFVQDRIAEFYARELAVFVGERVDNACHDGTTSAMMLFTGWAEKLFDVSAPPRVLSGAIDRAVGVLEDCIKADTVTVDELATAYRVDKASAKRFVAYHMAMISSKGDAELSRYVADVMAALPEELYSQYQVQRSEYETDHRFEVCVQEAELVLPGDILRPELYNTNLYTEYLNEDCDLLITSNQVIHGSPEHTELTATLRAIEQGQRPPFERDLVIIAWAAPNAQPFDDMLIVAVDAYNRKHTAKIVLMCMYNGAHRPFVPEAVRLMARAPEYYAALMLPGEVLTNLTIPHLKVRQVGKSIELSGLHQRWNPEPGALHHPAYTDPTLSEAYTDFVATLRMKIDTATRGIMKGKFPADLVNSMITLFRQMTCLRIVDLKLCGREHDHMADLSVAKDALGAAISAIETGFVFGGVGRMLRALTDAPTSHRPHEATVDARVRLAAIDTLTSILSVSYHGDLAHTFATDYLLPAEVSKYAYHVNLDTDGGTLRVVDFTDPGVWRFVSDSMASAMTADAAADERPVTVLIQPAAGYEELFKRLRELLPKMATTCCVIDVERRKVEGV